jgi:hypothetical protein
LSTFASALLLCGCVSMQDERDESRARLDALSRNLDAQSRRQEAARAATENCQELSAQGDCWAREYQRHLSDPAGASAEDSKERKRRSNVLLAKWTQCNVDKARELARSDLPAPEAVREAFARCDKERAEWVRAQGSGIRSIAESVASGSEDSSFPMLLGFIEDLRSGRRR